MREFFEGDLVEATKSEDIVRGRLKKGFCIDDLILHGWGLKPLIRDGYTLTVIDKAKPELPTEAGFYRVGGADNSVEGTVHLNHAGEWSWVGNVFGVNSHPQTNDHIHELRPLTRLEPVPETAQKVINRVRSIFGPDAWLLKAVAEIAKEFGAE